MNQQYRIIVAETFDQLEAIVSERLNAGWICQGGPFVTDDDLGGDLAQAMIFTQD